MSRRSTRCAKRGPRRLGTARVDGTLHGERQRARFFARNANVPMMLLAIGDGDALRRALDELSN